MNKTWNRSSSLNPEQLGFVTEITTRTIQDAIDRFEQAVEGIALSGEQRAEAVRLISEGVTTELANALENWKSSGVFVTK